VMFSMATTAHRAHRGQVCHRSPCPLGALRGQGKRLAAAAPFWGHRAAVAEPQWPHADGGGSGGCQGAAMPMLA
jgi:hypothetical protein